MNTATFRAKQRDQLGDTLQGAQSFDDAQLNGWRDDEVGVLYARGLFKKDTNYGSEIAITGSPIPLYYAMPALFRRINTIEFVSPTDATEIRGVCRDFDDLERPGYIRIGIADQFDGSSIRVFGEKEYSGIDDTGIKQEVIDVVLFGSCVRALLNSSAQRVQNRRSGATTRRSDARPLDNVTEVALMEKKLDKAVALAKAIQARSIQGG